MAYAASSSIWYTISHGILNEIYYPTIDRPQTRDMEFLLTDGETFFHEEKRDLDRHFEYIDSDALAVRLTNRDRQGRYSLIKEIIADPHHPVDADAGARWKATSKLLSRMKAYALLAPHLEVGGQEQLRSHARYSRQARAVGLEEQYSRWPWPRTAGFTRTSCGYVGSGATAGRT